ncbi:transposase family protein [Streptomyces mirabilis]|nr:transposase family protein [Streptomyces mirabilis]
MTDERGRVIWISAARPGRTHDITAARHDHTLAHLRAAGLGALADLGFRGLDNDVLDPVIVTGFHASRTHKLTPGQLEVTICGDGPAVGRCGVVVELVETASQMEALPVRVLQWRCSLFFTGRRSASLIRHHSLRARAVSVELLLLNQMLSALRPKGVPSGE